MTGKDKIIQKTSELLNIPGEVVTGMPVIEITGFNKVHIERHKGILEYGDKLIEINGGSRVIRVCGSALEIRAMNTEALLITGYITAIEFNKSL